MREYFLFSIRPEYATAIFSGVKRFELRRGSGEELKQGDIAIVYASGRVKRIFGRFIVGRIYRGPPAKIWRIVTSNRDSGVGRDARRYIEGSAVAVAIEVLEPKVFTVRPSLYEIRSIFPSWNPPLSYAKIDVNHPVFRLFIRPLLEEEVPEKGV